MRTVQASAHRIHIARRTLRPPNFHAAYPPTPRQFSQKSPRLLLISHRSVGRPQLPFLYPGQTVVSNGQILRLFSISASSRKYLKDTAKLTVKYTFLIWVVTTLFSIASLGFLSERQERAFPSPHEWSLYTRFRFRRGRWWEVPENNEDEGFPNYARLYAEYEHAQRRLEDPDIDGAGIVELKEDAQGEGMGATGFDLTAKSGEWRQGYYEVLMGMGRAAENMEGWVSDKWKWNAWSPEFIESPSNPRPKATPPGMQPPPPKEEQIPITKPPENFYLRILRSKGFTTYQRLTAALAYADWLSFKRDPAAEAMYHEALDIAISSLPTPNPTTVIDPRTAVLSSTAPKEAITSNLVYAATNMATHLASTGNITSALPIFISVLRARISLPVAPANPPSTAGDSTFLGTVLSLLKEPEYPPLPPTGDEPFVRTEAERCEEAALKNYIGEILFATATSPAQRKQGLDWVRDGVSTAKMAQSFDVIKKDTKSRKKCETCEEVGLESWGKMMTYLAAEAREQLDAVEKGSGWGIKGLWKWATGPGKETLEKRVEELEDEEEGVTMRLNKLRGRMLREEYAEMDRKYGRIFAF